MAVLESIVDAQWTDRFLDRHPGSKAIWIYRRHPDVARSAIVKWGDHQRWVINGIRTRPFAELGWRGERLSDHVVETIDRVHRPDLAVEEGAALFWWMRNSILWDRGLADDDRFVSDTTPKSVRDDPRPDISTDIRALCEATQDRLDLARAASLGRTHRRSRQPMARSWG